MFFSGVVAFFFFTTKSLEASFRGIVVGGYILYTSY